jgi:hypothetical protein
MRGVPYAPPWRGRWRPSAAGGCGCGVCGTPRSRPCWTAPAPAGNIFSIRIEYSGGICSNVPRGQYGSNDIGCGIKVHAYTDYNASGIRLGIVHYCHLTGRIPPNGAIYNRPGNTKWGVALGYVPAVPPSQNCYLSEHIHTCIYGDGGQAYRAYFACGASVSGGSTVLYWWVR